MAMITMMIMLMRKKRRRAATAIAMMPMMMTMRITTMMMVNQIMKNTMKKMMKTNTEKYEVFCMCFQLEKGIEVKFNDDSPSLSSSLASSSSSSSSSSCFINFKLRCMMKKTKFLSMNYIFFIVIFGFNYIDRSRN